MVIKRAAGMEQNERKQRPADLLVPPAPQLGIVAIVADDCRQ
ncbi:MAG: hypothetical protein V4444_10330 [Pseudomonadota bacterium]